MKSLRYFKMAAWMAVAIVIASCGSSRGLGKKSDLIVDESTSGVTNVADTLQKHAYLQKVNDNAQYVRYITSKVKFSIEVGTRQMTLTGNLKMKRDDVIRLQLMAFGFVEAGRLEFTQDYMLIVDRINKQYLKVPYAQLEFFRRSGVNFNMLQALFWNELFQPGETHLTDRKLKKFSTKAGADNEIVISIDNENLSYRWLTDQYSARINMTNVRYADHIRGNYQLNWDYSDFKQSNRKMFPMHHKVSVSAADKEVKLDMTINNISNDEDWEPRTVLSGKYRQMPVDEILRRFMSL